MDEHIFDKVQEVDMQKTMENYYIDYAMSVIASRALPDVRDGLKPVQRRILYSMYKEKNTYDKAYKKSARAVGDVMGKYHPHGDSSIYDAIVRMSQDWKMREPFVDMQGNNGSIDGDSPAASRYTEARLSKIANEMLRDIDKDTVMMAPNYDDTLLEPHLFHSEFHFPANRKPQHLPSAIRLSRLPQYKHALRTQGYSEHVLLPHQVERMLSPHL